MNTLVEQGMSIIMISSELPEVIGMSDRIYVVSGGSLLAKWMVARLLKKIMALPLKINGEKEKK